MLAKTARYIMTLALWFSLFPDSIAATTFISVVEIDEKKWKKEQRQLRKKWRPKCRRVWAKRDNLETLYAKKRYSKSELLETADNFSRGRYGCKESDALALQIMEDVTGENSLTASKDRLEKMIYLHGVVQGADHKNRILELRRILWVRGNFYKNANLLEWDEKERQAFIARGDIWEYLSRNKDKYGHHHHQIRSYFSPLSPYYDPAKAIELTLSDDRKYRAFRMTAVEFLLEGKDVPKDTERAETILWELAEHYDNARIKLLPMAIPKLNASDSATASAAADKLFKIATGSSWKRAEKGTLAIRKRLVPYYAGLLHGNAPSITGKSARHLAKLAELGTDGALETLKPWTEQKLKSKNPEDTLSVWRTVSRLSVAGLPAARPLLEDYFKQSGNVIEMSYQNAVGLRKGKRPFITTNDYPSRSLRREEEGVVSLEAIFSQKNRRAFEVFILKGATPQLNRAAVRAVRRRLRLQRDWPEGDERYVRVKLPDIQFRLPGCIMGDRITPKIKGALVVTGPCLQINHNLDVKVN